MKPPRINKLLTHHQLLELMSKSSTLTTYSDLVLVEELLNDLDPTDWMHDELLGRYAVTTVESVLGQLVVKACAQLRRSKL